MANKEFWQPIETAPKDKEILLYIVDEDGDAQIVSGCWEPETETDEAYWATSGGWREAESAIYWAEIPPLPKREER
jgi:hypothetical protein